MGARLRNRMASQNGIIMRALVASDDERAASQFCERLRRQCWECSSKPSSLNELVTQLKAGAKPDLVLVVLPGNTTNCGPDLKRIRLLTPHRLAVAGPPSSELILSVLNEIGADSYLDITDPEVELDSLLRRLDPHEPGRVIAVMSPSGGSGSTTLAVNLALTLNAADKKGEALIIDLNKWTGDVATLLDLQPQRTIADFCVNWERMDRNIFQELVAKHSSGVHVLAAPKTFADLNLITPEAIYGAVTLGRGMYRYVLLDMDHSCGPEQIEALRVADVILLVFQLQFNELKHVAKVVSYLKQMSISTDKVKLVVNRYGQPKEVSYREAERALGMPVLSYLPNDPKTVNHCNNTGVPLVLESPSARVSHAIKKLATTLNGVLP